MYHIVYYKRKFLNLKSVEFEGQIDEPTFIQFLIELKEYHQLTYVKLLSKGSYFNMKTILENNDIMLLKIFEYPYKLEKVLGEEDRSRL